MFLFCRAAVAQSGRAPDLRSTGPRKERVKLKSQTECRFETGLSGVQISPAAPPNLLGHEIAKRRGIQEESDISYFSDSLAH